MASNRWNDDVDVRLSNIELPRIPREGSYEDNALRHARFIESIFLEEEVFVRDSDLPHGVNYISAVIDGSLVAFGLNVVNQGPLWFDPKQFDVVFVMYGHKGVYEGNVYPFSPASYNTQGPCSGWSVYRELLDRVYYNPHEHPMPFGYLGIGCDWNPWRLAAKKELEKIYRLPTWKSFRDYLLQINTARAFIGSPGTMPFMVDRSVIQMMSLGCCVIHPKINYPFPNGGLAPGVHYLECHDDYNDIHKLYRDTDPNLLKAIGNNAKRYFQQWFTPKPLLAYVRRVIESRREGLESIRLSPHTMKRVDCDMRYSRHIERYRFAREHAHGRVIDWGAGCGYGSAILLRSPKVTDVFLWENDPDAIDWGERNYSKFNQPVSDCDTLIAFEILEHHLDNTSFFQVIDRVRPRTIVLSYPKHKSTHFNRWHQRDITAGDIDIPTYRLTLRQELDDSILEVWAK